MPLARVLSETWTAPFLVCIGAYLWAYGKQSALYERAMKVTRSKRFDLALLFALGAWSGWLIQESEPLKQLRFALDELNYHWALILLLALFCVLVSSIFRGQSDVVQTGMGDFISDEPIANTNDDLLDFRKQIEQFVNAVLDSGIYQNLAFGIDGPWGAGKTSFVNLAQKIWDSRKEGEPQIITCQFKPLRYSWAPSLMIHLIEEINQAIQEKIFEPELRPITSQLTKILKGRPEVSFMGFKISTTSTRNDIGVLLEQVNRVLELHNFYLIIVIDDLDRLDAKSCKEVLFASRQLMSNLNRASYVFCYDTEVLVNRTEDGYVNARDFLEKFIQSSFKLMIDSSRLVAFLREGEWQNLAVEDEIPSTSRNERLRKLFHELANLLDDKDKSVNYLPLIGNMRKLKLFVNNVRGIRLEDTNLDQTDFNSKDLIHLALLHFKFPGVFRRIYDQETQGREGFFSIKYDVISKEHCNDLLFFKFLGEQEESAKFLLRQLFEVDVLGFKCTTSINEREVWTRACFNRTSPRNLENYLKLIVQFDVPPERDTFTFMQRTFENFKSGSRSIESILNSNDFCLQTHGENLHIQFWDSLTNWSQQLNCDQLDEAIYTLIEYLPRYSMGAIGVKGGRYNGIHVITELLDRSEAPDKEGRNASSAIVDRIFGCGQFSEEKSIIRLLIQERGAIGWFDLMLFRLNCSADRGGVYSINPALIKSVYPEAETSGAVHALNVMALRRLSQKIFASFKETYIEPQRNFLAEARALSDEQILGQVSINLLINQAKSEKDLVEQIAKLKSMLQSFVVYQLSHRGLPNQSSVECGFFDEEGVADQGGISREMNQYLLDTCFDPQKDKNNGLDFFDYCLTNLNTPFESMGYKKGVYPSKQKISGLIDPQEFGEFWKQHGHGIRKTVEQNLDKQVITFNYKTSYRDQYEAVFEVLDNLAASEEGHDGESSDT